jgi:hypothetical protein
LLIREELDLGVGVLEIMEVDHFGEDLEHSVFVKFGM